MESERELLGKKQKDITIGTNRIQMEDLGTDNPELEIELKNNGPAREIEYCISENGRSRDWMPKLQSGSTVRFRLGEMGKGKLLVLVNNDSQAARISVSW